MSAGVIGVVVGLIFVYLVLSLICSGVSEAISGVLGLRAKTLEQGIGRLLGDGGRDRFYRHRLIEALTSSDGKKPSYIPSHTFALAVLSEFAPGVLDPATGGRSTRTKIDTALAAISQAEVREALQSLAADAEHDIDRFRTAIERWFDDTMQRASGWYARKAKLLVLAVGLVVAVGVNVDTFVVASSLWRDPTVRSAAVNAAKAAVANGAPGNGGTGAPPAGCPTVVDNPATAAGPGSVAGQIDCLEQLELPVGWTTQRGDPRRFPSGGGIPGRLLGWLVTAAALSLGAGFWFNALADLLGLRTSGTKPGTVPPTPTPSPPSAPAT